MLSTASMVGIAVPISNGTLFSFDITAAMVVTFKATFSVANPANTISLTQALFYAAELASDAGAVTSVGLSLPAEFTVSNSPVISAGTLTAAKATQAKNTAWMGPVSGSDAAPAFRPPVASDIPAGVGIAGADVASASTITPGVDGDIINITGTATITTINTTGRVTGQKFYLRFPSVCPITYDATKLILASGTSYAGLAGKVLVFEVIGTNQVRELALGGTAAASGGGVTMEQVLANVAMFGR